MTNCLNCNKEVQKTEGKRPKKFCSDNCRASFHNKNKKKEPKYVQVGKYKSALERIKLLEAQISSQGQKQTVSSKKEEVPKNHEKNENSGIKDLTTPPVIGKTDDNWLERRKRKLGF